MTLLRCASDGVIEIQKRRAEEVFLKTFTLYGTGACHLCELAHEMLLVEQSSLGGFAVEELDIGYSDALFERYGVRIPVLRHPDNRELGWPFSQTQLRLFLLS